jgi:hypothetical protein
VGVAILWFRRDLRLGDLPVLAAAVGAVSDGVLPQVTDLSIDRYNVDNPSQGRRTAAQPPVAERFCVAKASSTHLAEIKWQVGDGAYQAVIMSTNGHPGFATTSAIVIRLTKMPIYALAALLLGLLMAGAGTALLVRGPRQPGNGPNRTSSGAATTIA